MRRGMKRRMICTNFKAETPHRYFVFLFCFVFSVYKREFVDHRRCAKWPMLDLPLLNRLRRAKAMESHISPQLIASAKQLITAAGMHCDKENRFYHEGVIFAILEEPNPTKNYGMIFKYLYYRGGMQNDRSNEDWILAVNNFWEILLQSLLLTVRYHWLI